MTRGFFVKNGGIIYDHTPGSRKNGTSLGLSTVWTLDPCNSYLQHFLFFLTKSNVNEVNVLMVSNVGKCCTVILIIWLQFQQRLLCYLTAKTVQFRWIQLHLYKVCYNKDYFCCLIKSQSRIPLRCREKSHLTGRMLEHMWGSSCWVKGKEKRKKWWWEVQKDEKRQT